MRVLVAGSRTFTDNYIVKAVLTGLYLRSQGTFTVIEGGARGADKLAVDWATEAKADGRLVEHEQYLADWDQQGKAAGPRRNQGMLAEGKPDLVVAFVNEPLADSRGTADMVRRARAAGIPTYVIQAMGAEQ